MNENHDEAMRALFKALEEAGQLEEFLENHRRIEEAAQAAVFGMHSDPATTEGRIAIERAAELGDAHCQLKMAVIYGEGKHVPVNHRKALYFFEKAANENNSGVAQYYAGQYYAGLIDKSMPEDLDRAIQYLKKAINSKDMEIVSDAKELLGQIFDYRSKHRQAREQTRPQPAEEVSLWRRILNAFISWI